MIATVGSRRSLASAARLERGAGRTFNTSLRAASGRPIAAAAAVSDVTPGTT